jgi:hypothetical protein
VCGRKAANTKRPPIIVNTPRGVSPKRSKIPPKRTQAEPMPTSMALRIISEKKSFRELVQSFGSFVIELKTTMGHDIIYG